MLKSFTEGLRGRNAAFKKSVAGDIERLENGVSLSSYDRYLPIIYQRAATLFDYAEDALVFVCESASVEEHLRNFCTNQNEAVKHAFEDGLLCSGLDVFWMDSSELPSVLEDRGAVIMDNFPRGSYPVKLRLNEYIQCGQFSSWSGGIAGLAEDLDQGAGETSVVHGGNPKGRAVALQRSVRRRFQRRSAQEKSRKLYCGSSERDLRHAFVRIFVPIGEIPSHLIRRPALGSAVKAQETPQKGGRDIQ